MQRKLGVTPSRCHSKKDFMGVTAKDTMGVTAPKILQMSQQKGLGGCHCPKNKTYCMSLQKTVNVTAKKGLIACHYKKTFL